MHQSTAPETILKISWGNLYDLTHHQEPRAPFWLLNSENHKKPYQSLDASRAEACRFLHHPAISCRFCPNILFSWYFKHTEQLKISQLTNIWWPKIATTLAKRPEKIQLQKTWCAQGVFCCSLAAEGLQVHNWLSRACHYCFCLFIVPRKTSFSLVLVMNQEIHSDNSAVSFCFSVVKAEETKTETFWMIFLKAVFQGLLILAEDVCPRKFQINMCCLLLVLRLHKKMLVVNVHK